MLHGQHAVQEKNRNGDTLLYLALEKKTPEAVVMVLLEAWPDAVKENTQYGHTPLISVLQRCRTKQLKQW